MSENTERMIAENLFKEAIDSRDLGDLDNALAKLNEIVTNFARYEAPALGVMGNIYWDLKDWSKALACYKRVIKLSPESELASLGFFHTLWNLGRTDEAFDEMRRYLSIKSSEEYTQILKQINETSKN